MTSLVAINDDGRWCLCVPLMKTKRDTAQLKTF